MGCVVDGQTSFPRHWCTRAESAKQAHKCSFDRTGVNSCPALSVLSHMPDTQFKYFSDNSIDASSVMDYCPSARNVFINRKCTNTSSIFFPNGNINHMLEIFGDRSRCLMSTLRQPKILSGNLVYTADTASFASAEPV